jgi:hypothetical protein
VQKKKKSRLFSYALDAFVSIAQFAATNLTLGFSLPLSVEAFHEYQQVIALMAET